MVNRTFRNLTEGSCSVSMLAIEPMKMSKRGGKTKRKLDEVRCTTQERFPKNSSDGEGESRFTIIGGFNIS